MLKMRKILLLIFLLGFMAELAFAGAPGPGDKAPDFSLKSMSGDEVSLSDFKGKVVLIGMFHICVPKLKHLG